MPQNYSRLSTVKSSPKFSFRPRARAADKHDTPGPGAYSTVEAHSSVKFGKSASYSWGTAPRDGRIRQNSPGPGAYEASSKKASFGGVRVTTPSAQPEWRFGTQPRMLSEVELRGKESPGPGAYDNSDHSAVKDRSPRCRFGSQMRIPSPGPLSLYPGPGAYDAPKTGTVGEKTVQPLSAPQWKFGTDQRMRSRLSHSPGPGEYDTHKLTAVGETHVHKKAPRTRFGSDKRFPASSPRSAISPGPGAYGETYTVFGH
eukprot:TRINITY_DN10959_c0_g1_i1.p1 TRINITY_DN10959_c0_g1~~TRINITY_DN10959_c0_g1_i1.p1  ORF type:complete len:257 (-),score=25.99 TRINITY_DN10959_c0_g1_i1:216-986(-)